MAFCFGFMARVYYTPHSSSALSSSSLPWFGKYSPRRCSSVVLFPLACYILPADTQYTQGPLSPPRYCVVAGGLFLVSVLLSPANRPLYSLSAHHPPLCFAIPSALLPLVQFASLGSAYYTPRRSFFSLGLNRRSGSLTHSRPPALSFLSFAPLSTVHSPRSVSFGALCLFRQTIRSVGKRLTNHDFGFTARCLSYCRAGKPKT